MMKISEALKKERVKKFMGGLNSKMDEFKYHPFYFEHCVD